MGYNLVDVESTDTCIIVRQLLHKADMIPLNYNQLYYFFKIAEAGSIAEASKQILISSPALSMQLKELEESLEVALFDRVGKKLILTESGAIVLEYAKDIFKLGFELKDTIKDRNINLERSRIEIGCQDSIPKNIADELISFLIKERNCKVLLKEGNREELIGLQNDYKLDLILTNSIPSVDNSYIYETKLLKKEELIIVGHPKFAKSKNKLNDIKKHPFILPTFDSSVRQKLENWFVDKKIQLDVVAEVEDKATEIDLALRGLGLVIVMKSSVKHLIKEKYFVELYTLSHIEEEVWMIIGKRKILNPNALFAMKNFVLS